MPVCDRCGSRWTWKQTFKKSFTLDTGMVCPYCGVKQYVTQRSRKKSAPFLLIAPLLILLNFVLPYTIVIPMFILLPVIYLSIYPRLIELSNEEELPF